MPKESLNHRITRQCRSADGRRTLRNLERQLANNTNGEGYFEAQETAVIDLTIKSYNRFADLELEYDKTNDGELKVKYSAEMRQLTTTIAKLLGMIDTSPPPAKAPPSKRTQQATQAANARWRTG